LAIQVGFGGMRAKTNLSYLAGQLGLKGEHAMAKLRWGLIGGGESSQIGGTHRVAAGLDGAFDFVAGALDIDPDRGRAFAKRLGVSADRAYGDWREMLEGERTRSDRIDLVTVATPNASHYQIIKAFLMTGFEVLCEKPLFR
jgi:predicted dehydrogenase